MLKLNLALCAAVSLISGLIFVKRDILFDNISRYRYCRSNGTHDPGSNSIHKAPKAPLEDIENKIRQYENTIVDRADGLHNLWGTGFWSNLDDDGTKKKTHWNKKKKKPKKHDGEEPNFIDSESNVGSGSDESGEKPKGYKDFGEKPSKRKDFSKDSGGFRRDGDDRRGKFNRRESEERGGYRGRNEFRDRGRFQRDDGFERRGRFDRRDDSEDSDKPKKTYNFNDKFKFKPRESAEKGRSFGDDRGGYRRNFGNDRGGYRRNFGDDRGGYRRSFGDDRGGYRRSFDDDRGGYRRSFGDDRGGYRRGFGDDRGGFRRNFDDDRGGYRGRRNDDGGGDRGNWRRRYDDNKSRDDRRGYYADRGRYDRGGRRDFSDRGGRGDRESFQRRDDYRKRDDYGKREGRRRDGETTSGDWKTDPNRPTGEMAKYWDKIQRYTNDPKVMKFVNEFFENQESKQPTYNGTKSDIKEYHEKQKKKERFKALKRQVRNLEQSYLFYKRDVRKLEGYYNYSLEKNRTTQGEESVYVKMNTEPIDYSGTPVTENTPEAEEEFYWDESDEI